MVMAKKYFKFSTVVTLLLFALLTSISAHAQDDEDKRVKKRPGLRRFFTGYRAPEAGDKPKTDRLLVDLYWNSWTGDLNGVKTKWYSVGFNTSIMADIPFAKKSPVGIGIGIGFSHFNIHHSGRLNPDTLTDGNVVTNLDNTLPSDVKTNKFTANYIEVPFEFRLRLGKKNPFKFSPGFKVGIMTNSYNKYKLDNGNKYKDFNFPDGNLLRYGVTARIGVGIFMFYGSYFFSDLFTNDQSTRLNPFTLGISLSLF